MNLRRRWLCKVTTSGDMVAKTREKGTTFVNELLALAIMGSAIVVLLAGLSTSSMGVAAVDRQVRAEDYARWQMEVIKAAPYQPNPTTVPYPSVSGEGVYSVSTEVSYWITSTETFTTILPAQDSGLQQIRVLVYSSQQPSKPVVTLQGYRAKRP